MSAWRVRKGGTRFWASVVIDQIRHPSSQTVGFAKITRDLTERKVAEQVLHQSEEQFRLLVQGVSDYAIYLLDLNGNVTNWNLGAQRIKGYLPNEIIGQHFSRFYTDEERAANVPQQALETAEGQGRYEREGWRIRKDGHVSGLTSSLMPFATTAELLSDTPRSHATSPTGRKPRKNGKGHVSYRSRRKRWRRLAN